MHAHDDRHIDGSVPPGGSAPPIALRTPAEIAALRSAGSVVCDALRAASAAARPGTTTAAVADAAQAVLDAAGAEPLFVGYRQGDSPPFPSCACVSVNEEVVHGIPGERRLAAGDIVTIDVGLKLDGWCGDSASSVLVMPGRPDDANGADAAVSPGVRARLAERAALIRATRDVLDLAVRLIRPGVSWSSVALGLEEATARSGYRLVTEYVGHGIGRSLHEPPKAPCYWSGFTGADFVLAPGMVLAVEPMLTTAPATAERFGGAAVERASVSVGNDGWTVRTAEGSSACHEEFMVAVTARGAEVLTARARSPLPASLAGLAGEG